MTAEKDVTVVVSAHELRREIPRTVRSLSPPYQIDVDPARIEIIVADNGSTEPVEPSWFEGVAADLKIMRFAPGNPSPCAALNAAVAAARGTFVTVLIDGARIASPGILARGLAAMRIADEVFAATMGFHLGLETQQRSQLNGYCADVEDRMLEEIGWPQHGHRLFEICSRGESYRNGVLSDFPETTAFMVRRETYLRLGGFDERFRYRGGGLANFEFYERMLCDEGIVPIMLIGEGTFHQVHDGNTTRANGVSRRETPDGPTIWEAMSAEFESIVGRVPVSLQLRKPLLFGRCETTAAERCFFAKAEAPH